METSFDSSSSIIVPPFHQLRASPNSHSVILTLLRLRLDSFRLESRTSFRRFQVATDRHPAFQAGRTLQLWRANRSSSGLLPPRCRTQTQPSVLLLAICRTARATATSPIG